MDIWYKNPKVLLDTPIYSDRQTTDSEKYNSLFLTSVIVGAILSVISRDSIWIVSIVGAVIVSTLYKFEFSGEKERFTTSIDGTPLRLSSDGKIERGPSVENPAMNRVYGENIGYDRAMSSTSKEIQQKIVEKMDESGRIAPRSDPINRRINIRQAMTTPDQSNVPDARDKFCKHLIGNIDDFNFKSSSINFPKSKISGFKENEVF
jgi:hypothetical protein